MENKVDELEVIIPLLNKNMKIIQRADHFNFSLDSLLISEFIKITRNVSSIVDLGTGNGAIPLFLSKKCDSKIYGFEIQKISAELARRNVKINNLEDQIEIINDDMKNFNNYFKKGEFDLVVSNPPFFEVANDNSYLNKLEQLSIARHEVAINLNELVKVSSELLKDRGYFYLVHRASRLIEIIEILKKYSLEPKRIRFCHTKDNKEAKIILIESFKNGKSGLKIMPPLYANKENGEYSDEVLKMFDE